MRSEHMVRTWPAIVIAGLCACGGGQKTSTATGGGGGGGGEEVWGDSGGDGASDAVVGPERMDEIKGLLDRKRTAAARCFADAVNHGKVAKNARGHVMLGFVITTGGKATQFKVLETSLDSPDVEGCVIKKVESIDFGALPHDLDWSYTYAFESM